MADLISRFGIDNLIILLILLFIVALVTLIAFISDAKNKKLIKVEIVNSKIIEEAGVEEQSKEPKQKVILEESKHEIVEEQKETKQEEAKAQLKQLEEELSTPKEDKIGPTSFEVEQEKSAIINYDELKKISNNIDEKDRQLLKDEGDEPISIDEIYQKENLRKIEMMDFKQEENKFKNSEVLSPVFGVTKENKYLINDIRDVEMKTAVELEIEKTERFLKELKKLKSKLD